MALSLILGEAKLKAEQMETKADVTLEKVADGFAITAVHLTLTAKIPGTDDTKFQELAGMAKAGCPASKLLNTNYVGREVAVVLPVIPGRCAASNPESRDSGFTLARAPE